MARITIREALNSIKDYIFGTNTPNDNGEPDIFFHCNRCGNILHKIRESSTDFKHIDIYKCNNCNSISEFQSNLYNELERETHIYNPSVSDQSFVIETSDLVPINHFSINQLWVICNKLCYPVLIRSEITNGAGILFVECGNDINYNHAEGFIVSSTNIIGEVRIIRESELSYIFNPYLARLPHIDYMYISYPTQANHAIEYTSGIRFRHKISGTDPLFHELSIMKDVPMECYGLEVEVHFVSPVEDTNLLDLIYKIGLDHIMLGEPVQTLQGYSIQFSRLMKYTLGSVSYDNIDIKIRESFYKDIIKVFSDI